MKKIMLFIMISFIIFLSFINRGYAHINSNRKIDLLLDKNLKVIPKICITIKTEDYEILTENEKYKKLAYGFVKKVSSFIIEELKKYNKDLKGDSYTFELVDINGNVVLASNKDNILFDIKYDADSLGYIVYNIGEKIKKAEGDNHDSTVYEIIVLVNDIGETKLSFVIDYQDKKIKFINDIDNTTAFKEKEDKIMSPQTYDNIIKYRSMLIISSLTSIYIMKKIYNQKRRLIKIN